MKAEFNASGVITISPENAVEAYALRHWVNVACVVFEDPARGEHGFIRGSSLVIDVSWDKD